MAEIKTFDYECDWVDYFDSYLKNELREEIDKQNLIKANIIESNQDLETFLKRNPRIQRIPSKEEFFHNLRINFEGLVYYFYLNNRNPRFWTVHNIEKQKRIQKIIEDLTGNSYLQDKIYLSHNTMDNYQDHFNTSSLGFTLKFEQLFTLNGGRSAFIDELEDFNDIGFTLKLWPKRRKSIKFFINRFREINCPINYDSLNFVFEDETQDVLVKEDLYYDGSFTIHRGKKFREHIKFINGVKEDYNNKMNLVEEKRINFRDMKGGLFIIRFDKKIEPRNFVSLLNKNSKHFKVDAYFMYKESNFEMYNCIDIHTGGQFYLQVFPNRININLDENSCGNIIFRLFTNLQRYFSISVRLYVDGEEMNL
ncbi:MAG: hypothetical protein GF329_03055 [Candidatus Lokiarchaeota archaeon]|nr:hypothetical protein [Candidatus Lokiarchaeota archaeon]